MLHLVLLGFTYASNKSEKAYALSSSLALTTTADDVPDLWTFFSSSLCFKYRLFNLFKKFETVSPKITKNKEGLICTEASLPCILSFDPQDRLIVTGTYPNWINSFLQNNLLLWIFTFKLWR